MVIENLSQLIEIALTLRAPDVAQEASDFDRMLTIHILWELISPLNRLINANKRQQPRPPVLARCDHH
jgi:hypothetical protein